MFDLNSALIEVLEKKENNRQEGLSITTMKVFENLSNFLSMNFELKQFQHKIQYKMHKKKFLIFSDQNLNTFCNILWCIILYE